MAYSKSLCITSSNTWLKYLMLLGMFTSGIWLRDPVYAGEKSYFKTLFAWETARDLWLNAAPAVRSVCFYLPRVFGD